MPPGTLAVMTVLSPAEATATPLSGTTLPETPLRRNRDFLVVLIGQGVSSFGDAISATALPILVLALTGSGFVMGIVGVLSTLPDLLIGLPAGAYADRWDRRRMMLFSDVGRAVLTALVPLSVWLAGPTLAVVLLVTFPLNVLRVLWLAAYTAAVPGLVGREHVPRASGLFEAVFNIGWIVGPALAGLLTQVIGPGPTIAIDAASFVVSALALFLVRRPLRAEARAEPTHILSDVREGIRFVAGHRTLRSVLVLWTTMSVLTAGLGTAVIFFVTIDQALGSAAVGLVLSAFAVGSLLGALLAARLAVKAVGRAMLLGAVGTGGSLLVIAAGPSVAVMAAVALLAGILNANMMVAYISLRTMLSPDALLGRVGATARTLSVGLMPVGSLVTGVLLDAVGGGLTLALMGGATLVMAAAFGLVPDVRRARLAV